jgi:O-antigen/teichoic acid export membrane protein
MTQTASEINTPETGLAQHTVRGMMWTLIQTLGSKGVGFVAQIFLARLLTPNDWGLAAATYAATMLPNVFRQTGMVQILVARQKYFRRWAVHAFWFEIALGLLAVAGMCLAAPLAVAYFGAPQLLWMTFIVALGAGIGALGVLSNAMTMIQLRFGQISLINLYTNIVQSALSVLLAFWHFGAYSFVVPLPIVSALRVYATWRLVRKELPPIRWEINLPRWRKLASGNSALMIASLAMMVTWMVYPLALKKFHPKEAMELIGLWFFALNLSNQVIVVLANNLTAVLFPTLSKIKHDPKRQMAGFLRAAQALVLITTFACVLEALLARPGLEVLFGTKWLAAIVPLQFFALASIFFAIGSPICSILLAQERYNLYLWYNLLSPLTLIPLLYLGSWRYGVTGLAIAALLQSSIAAPLGVALVTGGGGRLDWLSPLKVFWGSILCGAVAGAVVLAIMSWIPALSKNNIEQIIVICAIFGLVYPALAWLLCRTIMKELISHARHLLHRFMPRGVNN